MPRNAPRFSLFVAGALGALAACEAARDSHVSLDVTAIRSRAALTQDRLERIELVVDAKDFIEPITFEIDQDDPQVELDLPAGLSRRFRLAAFITPVSLPVSPNVERVPAYFGETIVDLVANTTLELPITVYPSGLAIGVVKTADGRALPTNTTVTFVGQENREGVVTSVLVDEAGKFREPLATGPYRVDAAVMIDGENYILAGNNHLIAVQKGMVSSGLFVLAPENYCDKEKGIFGDADGDGANCRDDCDDSDPTLNTQDIDKDSFSTCDDDCDDTDPLLNLDDADRDGITTCSKIVATPDNPGSAVSDCDESVETGSLCSADCILFYADNDLDGLGDRLKVVEACKAPTGYVNNNSDCNDNNITCGLSCTDRDGDKVCSASDCDESKETGALCSTSCVSIFKDSDGDGLGTKSVSRLACAESSGWVDNSNDCFDGNRTCTTDCRDQDRDGTCITLDCDDAATTGASCTTGCVTFYRDFDGDNLGDPTKPTQICSGQSPAGLTNLPNDCNDSSASCKIVCGDADGDGSPCDFDCNDSNPNVNPNEIENCNDGVDNNCNGFIDLAEHPECDCPDNDLDGYRCSDDQSLGCSDYDPQINPSDADNDKVTTCLVPNNLLAPVDCNDNNANMRSNLVENCRDSGIDNDCDTLSDAADVVDCPTSCFADLATYDTDNDGYFAVGCSPGTADCDDDSGQAAVLTLKDQDRDGFTPCGGDCNDSSAQQNPGKVEKCFDSIDNDCDGLLDALDILDCPNGCVRSVHDLDGDGVFGFANGVCMSAHADCDDSSTMGGKCSTGCISLYRDADTDNYGVNPATLTACAVLGGYSDRSGDCNDNSGSVSPGHLEVCGNGVDEDCSGTVGDRDIDRDDFDDVACGGNDCDDNNASKTPLDLDGDGQSSCGGDCNDSDPVVKNGQTEVCDGKDNNCDGIIDNLFGVSADGDGDGVVDCNDNCPQVANITQSDGDNDKIGNACDACSSVTLAVENCFDGVDNDCDGQTSCGSCSPGNDSDGDGFAVVGAGCTPPSTAIDCAPADASVNPGQVENTTTCADGKDNDCDNLVDSADPGCGGVLCPAAPLIATLKVNSVWDFAYQVSPTCNLALGSAPNPCTANGEALFVRVGLDDAAGKADALKICNTNGMPFVVTSFNNVSCVESCNIANTVLNNGSCVYYGVSGTGTVGLTLRALTISCPSPFAYSLEYIDYEKCGDFDHDSVFDCQDTCIDADGDGSGIGPNTTGCPNGASLDCDDSRATVGPLAAEVCDGLDNNCNNTIDESGAGGFFGTEVVPKFTFETLPDPQWAHAPTAVGGNDNWAQVTAPFSGPLAGDGFGVSNRFYGTDGNRGANSESESSVLMGPKIFHGSPGKLYASFRSYSYNQGGCNNTDFDVERLEVSFDDGVTWPTKLSFCPDNRLHQPYDGTIRHVAYNLSGYVPRGAHMKFRFMFATNGGNGNGVDDGWYIDDFRLYTCP